jgi:hypothetical protein
MLLLSRKEFVGTPVISLDLFKNTPSDFSLANQQVAWDTWTKGPSKNCANKPQDSGKTANGPLAHRLRDCLADYISLCEQQLIPNS